VSDDPDLPGIRKDQRYSAMLSQIECQHLMYKSGLVSGSRADLPERSFRSLVVYGLGGTR